MLNHIDIMGRLTRDPELRRTASGVAVASFTLAVDRDYADKETGARGCDFIDCTAWRTTAEFISKYFSKGQMMAAAGRLEIRAYKDKDGNNRRAAEVRVESAYFGGKKGDDVTHGETTKPAEKAPDAATFAELDDDTDLQF